MFKIIVSSFASVNKQFIHTVHLLSTEQLWWGN